MSTLRRIRLDAARLTSVPQKARRCLEALMRSGDFANFQHVGAPR